MVDIPEDLRHLRDFPTYDTTFQDGPKFRQNLQYWTFKTEKVGVAKYNKSTSIIYYPCQFYTVMISVDFHMLVLKMETVLFFIFMYDLRVIVVVVVIPARYSDMHCSRIFGFFFLLREGSKFNPLGYFPFLSPQLALTLTSLATL